MSRGYVIIAQNTTDVDYVYCAETLAMSIRNVMPYADITLISDDVDDSKYFDKVVALPYGDLAKDSKWKLINDWQVYDASPYDETIKLEADMIVPRNIDYWWDVLSLKDVVVSTHIRDFKGNLSDCMVYRRFIENNKLPNTYNSITYFKKSETAQRFFNIVRDVFEYWPDYRGLLQSKIDEEVSTDWAYSLACHIIGIEHTTLPMFDNMSMVHMKQFINNTHTEDWTDSLIYEISKECLRVNTIPQYHPFHYHVKSFSKKLREVYEQPRKQGSITSNL